MPLGRGVRYRVKTTPKGAKIRLAFKGDKVVETKKLDASTSAPIFKRNKRS